MDFNEGLFIRELLLERIEQLFKNVAGEFKIKIDPHSIAEKYIEFYTYETTDYNLIPFGGDENAPGSLIKLNLLAAAGFVASIITGIAGATIPLVVGCVIISSIASLNSLYEKTTHSEAVLFWVVYEMEKHLGSYSDIHNNFNSLCKEINGVEPEDFRPALNKLIAMRAIEQQGNLIKVSEKFVILWFRGN